MSAAALLLQVRNIPELVKSQGGNVGKLAFMAAPGTITNKVYSEMASQMLCKMQEQGVDAEIRILDDVPEGGKVAEAKCPPKAPGGGGGDGSAKKPMSFTSGLFIGGASVGLLALVIHLMVKK